jgi:hypothetical protein
MTRLFAAKLPFFAPTTALKASMLELFALFMVLRTAKLALRTQSLRLLTASLRQKAPTAEFLTPI